MTAVTVSGDVFEIEVAVLPGDGLQPVAQGVGIFAWGLVMLQGEAVDDGLADV